MSLFVVVSAITNVKAQAINTFAGTGVAGFSGDGGPAISAQLNNPSSVVVDAVGNVYIADQFNNRIRKIGTDGIINTIAGTGTSDFSGDGGPAISADLNNPSGLAISPSGELYFCDRGNNRIRKIDASGIISTVAGVGGFGFSGDGGPATAAMLGFPEGIAFDASGNLYLADQNNCRVRKVNTSGIITTIGGTGICAPTTDGVLATSANIQYPTAVAVDNVGNIYVSDNGNNRIRKINTSGIISTVTGSATYGFTGDGGPANLARVYYPRSVWTDLGNNIYFSDYNNFRIRRILASSGIINTVIGNGVAGFSGDGGLPLSASINYPTGFAINESTGAVYIADNANNRIRFIRPSYKPHFTGGDRQEMTACMDGGATSINTYLAAIDTDIAQPLSWGIVSVPSHGTVITYYTTSSTGAVITPTGLTYTPALGYVGLDSFKVRVSDGALADTTKIVVNIIAPPVPTPLHSVADSVCVNDTTTFYHDVVGGTFSNVFSTISSISSTGLVTGLAPGVDTIKYTVTLPCGSYTVAKPILVSNIGDCYVSVKNALKGNLGLEVYPNPSKGSFIVMPITASAQLVEVTLSNLMGQVIKSYTFTSNANHEVKSDLAAGMYIVTLKADGYTVNKRLVIYK